jgi:hypothetical protein
LRLKTDKFRARENAFSVQIHCQSIKVANTMVSIDTKV